MDVARVAETDLWRLPPPAPCRVSGPQARSTTTAPWAFRPCQPLRTQKIISIFVIKTYINVLENVGGQWLSVPKLQSCLGVGVDNSSLKETLRVENSERNVGYEFYKHGQQL